MWFTRLIAFVAVAAFPVLAANSSGIWIDAGVSLIGPKSDELDKQMGAFVYDHYYIQRSIGSDYQDSISRASFIEDFAFHKDIAPSFTIGYEHSINPVLSLAAGVGIRFGATSYNLEQGNGFSYDGDGDLVGVDSNNLKLEIVNSFTSLVVPVEMKVMIPIRSGGIFFTAAPELSFLFAAERKEDVIYTVTTSRNRNAETDISDDYNAVGFGLGFKLGGEIGIGKHNLLIESGYTAGLSNIAKEEGITMKNGEITLLQLGFRFNTGR